MARQSRWSAGDPQGDIRGAASSIPHLRGMERRLGQMHRLRVCPIQGDRRCRSRAAGRGGVAAATVTTLVCWPIRALPRIGVTASITPPTRDFRAAASEDTGQRLTGTLVHRLFERHGAGFAVGVDLASVIEELRALVGDEESVEADDLDRVLAAAGDAYLALCAQPALSAALQSGEALFEVPFSVRPAASQVILRGTFDCLVRGRDGGATVLELKTGKPLPEHDQQLSAYVAAARALFPGARVEGKLVYAAR